MTFALISEKNVSASESPILVNTQIDITEIRLLNQAANFQIAVGPTAKSRMIHWLRNPDVEDKKLMTHRSKLIHVRACDH